MSSPYHPGELAVQRRAGVLEDAARVGRILGRHLSSGHARLLSQMRMAVAASLDPEGRVWASLLTGEPGFIRPVDETLVLVDALPGPVDVLAKNVTGRPELGLLAIDLASRSRVRLNGRALLDPERGLFLALEQVYVNCPKYIHPRPSTLDAGRLTTVRRLSGLDPGQQRLVASADTFFLATAHPQGGADASHRGGDPGFVHVLGARTVEFPDYPGNNMFNSLGNLVAEPSASLLFLDFARGETLQLTGRAAVAWEGARARVTFEIDEARHSTAGPGIETAKEEA